MLLKIIMIIKAISWTSPVSPAIAINYLDSGRCEDNSKDFVIYRNCFPSKDSIIAELKKQRKLIKKRANNSGRLNVHTIASFSPESTKHLTKHKLIELAHLMIKEISIDNTVLQCVPHYQKKHVHLHFFYSANPYGQASVSETSLSRDELIKALKNIERQQSQLYPELNDSLVFSNIREKRDMVNEDRVKRERNYRAMKCRIKDNPTEKEILFSTVQKTINESSDAQELMDLLLQQGIQPYRTSYGKIAGVQLNNRKYRWKTVGVPPEQLKQLQNKDLTLFERKQQLEQVQEKTKQKQKIRL